MIRVVDVTQHYSVKPVLKHINLEFPEGSTTVIIGPNGMGKTTLLSVMAGTASVDVRPRPSYIRRQQHELARQANLISHSYGREPRRRVRIYRDER